MKTSLCNFTGSKFWPENTWAELAALPNKDQCLIILPITPLANYGEDKPMNSGETALLNQLSQATTDLHTLILPPIRQTFTTRQDPTFTDLPFDTALADLLEIAHHVKIAGFSKLTLITTLDEAVDLIDIAALDIRTNLGLSTFYITPKALQSEDLKKLLHAMIQKAPLKNNGQLPTQTYPQP